MANTALVQTRVDPCLKHDVENVLNANGLDVPTAIRMYFSKIAQVGGIPFDVRIFNAETITAMDEAEAIATDPDAKSYSSFSELLEDSNGINGQESSA